MSKLKVYFRLLVLFVVAGGAAVAWWTGLMAKEQGAAPSTGTTEPARPVGDGPKEYTATAALFVAPSVPHTMRSTPEKLDLDEFEMYRNTHAALLRQRFVLMAALRNPKMKGVESVLREDARHNTIGWLASIIKVKLEKKTSIMTVSVTLPDRNEAATIVNAVVQAYMDEVVNRDRDRQRERFDSLTEVSVQKEEEFRKLREDLKREMESIGAGDDATVGLRTKLALNTCTEYQSELRAMRREHSAIQCRLQEATTALKELRDARISDLEVSRLLVSIPVYCDLSTRMSLRELENHRAGGAASETKPPQEGSRRELSDEELAAARKMLDELKSQCRTMIREARRIELENEVHKLATRLEFAGEHVLSFQKEVDAKVREVDQIGRSTVAAHMLRAKLENVERILRGVTDERERLKIELDNSRPRVSIVGDPSAPAAVPEKPD
jgi:hypothetical protein